MKKLLFVGLISLSHATAYCQFVSFNIDAEVLKTAGGTAIPTSGLVILVASTLDASFGGPTDTSFVSGDDIELKRWDLSSGFNLPGILSVFSGPLQLTGNWNPGDPVQMYWFPTLTLGSIAPGPGTSYGQYRDAVGIDGSEVWTTPAAGFPVGSRSLRFSMSDATFLFTGGSMPALAGKASSQSQFSGRHVFYNRSAFDGNDPSANASDDGAIATDKTALLPGGTATLANYTSYSRGINGIMVDIASLPGTPTASDFSFKVGNDNTPNGWGAAPAPTSISVRLGAGVSGSDRVTLIWADNAIQKEWLQITVKATAATGLAADDVFYFGNAIGEAGNSATDAKVDPADELLARAHPRNTLNPAPIDDLYDYNRDKRVDPADQLIARSNSTSILTALRLIVLP
jgi:hypothetical protein